MGSPLGAAKYNSLLQGAASLDRLGTTALAAPDHRSAVVEQTHLFYVGYVYCESDYCFGSHHGTFRCSSGCTLTFH